MQANTKNAGGSFALTFLVFGFLNFLDVYITRVALMLPGTSEGNPIMASMFRDGFMTALFFKIMTVSAVGLIALFLWHIYYVRKILIGGIVAIALIVVYQIYGITQQLSSLV